jgi:formate dehydrogenase subunit gamma
MLKRGNPVRTGLVIFGSVALIGLSFIFSPRVSGQQAPAIPREDEQACLACHSQSMGESVPAVDMTALQASAHKDKLCQDCHAEVTSAPHTPAMIKSKPTCVKCHGDWPAGAVLRDHPKDYLTSVHARKDKVPGDHPTCVSCHGGGNPHAVQSLRTWNSKGKAELCSKCHAQASRMARYGVDPDAVRSYNESFHGKALLVFGVQGVATCTDCHHAHEILTPSNAASSTNAANVSDTCGGCHKGAQANFALSGANHLRLKAKQSAVLRWELLFFKAFVFGMLLFLISGVILDLRRKVFTRGHVPSAGRTVSVLVAISFLCVAVALGLATASIPGARRFAILAVASMALAFAIYFAQRRKAGPAPVEKTYPRLSLILRIQHVFLMVSFTLLALTGLPMRFSTVAWVGDVYVLFGGLAGARVVHRGAAVVMIFTFVWHLGYLLLLWKRAGFSFKSWTMVPTRKDLDDFIGVSKYYLGITHTQPKFKRFQFREKMDYLAEYWGVPLMVLSGFVMWFPVFWGNRLPETAVSFAFIAHSYEATLAFLGIVTWHMYNAHFNPDAFPMSKSFYTGTMTREEMEREHPLELEDMEKECDE